MEISKNKWYIKLYLWFYCIDENDLPQSLCPFFWRLLLMFIFIIPYSIVSLPSLFIEKYINENKTEEGSVIFMLRILFGLVGYVSIGCISSIITFLICLILQIEPEENSDLGSLVTVGFVLSSLILVGLLIRLVIYLYSLYDDYKWNKYYEKKWNPEKYPVKERKSSILKEFIKAKYNKYCPKITWK